MHEREDQNLQPPAERVWASRSHLETLVLIGATAIGSYICFQLALPFLPAVAWALALAVLFTPFHRWMESKIKRPGLAAAASVLVVATIVAVPAIFVGQRLVQETVKGAAIVARKVETGEWRQAISAQPRLASLADWIGRTVDLPGTAKDLTAWLTAVAGAIVRGSVIQAIGFCLTFYLLFYFLRDRRAALKSLRSWSPFTAAEMDRLFVRVDDTICATVYGTLAVAAVQGLLGGLMFWWLGLPLPLLWGVVMALLAILPVLGAFIIWIPAALFLALDGNWGKALILAVWGTVVVGGIDNALQPFLIGKRLKLHTILAFISVVGGLMLFGAAGLILGPVALTATVVLLEVWRQRTMAPASGKTLAKQPLRDRPDGR